MAVEVLQALEEAKERENTDRQRLEKEQYEDFAIRTALVASGADLVKVFPERFLEEGEGEQYDYSAVEWMSPTEGSSAEEFEETQRVLMAMLANQTVGVKETAEGEIGSAEDDREWV